MMRSLRWRLLAGMMGAMLAVLLLLGAVLYVAVRHSLLGAFEASTIASARALAGHVEQKAQEVKFDSEELNMPEFRRARHPDYYQLWREDGSPLARSPSLGTKDLPPLEGTMDGPGACPLVLPNGNAGRACGFSFPARQEEADDEHADATAAAARNPAKPQWVRVVVARESTGLEAQLRNLFWLLLAALGGSVMLSLLAAKAVVSRGLRPLNALATDIAGVGVDNLGTRIRRPAMPKEMIPIVNRLNELLERLEAAFQRERSFTADVAHELRTPLSGLQSVIDFARSRVRATGEYQEAFEDCQGICRRMRSMVGNLLLLARLDAGRVKPAFQEIGIREMVESCWKDLAPKAATRRLNFTNELPPDSNCQADRGLLAMVFSNLLANAVEYADEGGRIWIQASSPGRSVVTVANTGCPLTQRDVAHVFERFWRGDLSRTGRGEHCGLGLALARRAMTAMGGSITAGVESGIYAAVLEMPSPPPAPLA